MFKHEPCECPPNTCLKQVEPPADCVNRLQGVVEAAACPICKGETIHHNGTCLRCQRMADKVVKETWGDVPSPSSGDKVVPKVSPGLTLRIKCGDEFVVSDKKQVAKILKILLED
jgi:hypothetical protein